MKLEESWKVQLLSSNLNNIVLLDDIAQNRHRVQTIFQRLADAEGDEEQQLSFTLKQLALEELLSEEQHLELAKALQNDDLDSSRVAEVIKNTNL